MTLEQKQIHHLERLYTNVDFFKSLRVKLPTIVIGVNFGIIAILIENKDTPFKDWALVVTILVVALIGHLSYNFVHQQFKQLVDEIIYLRERMGMGIENPDFNATEHQEISVSKIYAKRIFALGFSTIWILSILCCLIVLFGK